jgi:hypothetical protein
MKTDNKPSIYGPTAWFDRTTREPGSGKTASHTHLLHAFAKTTEETVSLSGQLNLKPVFSKKGT